MAKDQMSDSEIEFLARQIDVAAIKKREKERVASSVEAAKKMPPELKESWLEANEELAKAIANLELVGAIAGARAAANRARLEATAAPRGAPCRVLRVIDGGADSEDSDEG